MASSPSPSPSASPSPSPSPPSAVAPLPEGILTLALPAPNAPRPTPPPPLPSSSRRIPPPCWSHDETLALISSYKEKWDSLRRGVLRAPDWEDVAASVSRLCPLQSPNPAKTPLQCRHKIEKLRKRYRAERLRAARANPSAPPRSTWLYFKKMDEIGLAVPIISVKTPPSRVPISSSSAEEDSLSASDAEDEDLRRPNIPPAGNGGLRFRIPVGGGDSKPASRFGNGYVGRRPMGSFDNARRGFGKRKIVEEEEEEDRSSVLRGLVSAVRGLADGYMRMEHMNIDMMREIEKMRIEMDLKQTEMMLDTQRKIVDLLARRISGRKKANVSADC